MKCGFYISTSINFLIFFKCRSFLNWETNNGHQFGKCSWHASTWWDVSYEQCKSIWWDLPWMPTFYWQPHFQWSPLRRGTYLIFCWGAIVDSHPVELWLKILFFQDKITLFATLTWLMIYFLSIIVQDSCSSSSWKPEKGLLYGACYPPYIVCMNIFGTSCFILLIVSLHILIFICWLVKNCCMVVGSGHHCAHYLVHFGCWF